MPVEKGDYPSDPTEPVPQYGGEAPQPYGQPPPQQPYGQPPPPQPYGQPPPPQPYGQPPPPQYGQPQYGNPQFAPAQPLMTAPGAMTMTTRARPPDYVVPAILATLCCFWPTGICAIIKANEANSAAGRGDMESAYTLYRSARQFTIISVVAGILSIVVAAIIVGVYVGVYLNTVSSIYSSY